MAEGGAGRRQNMNLFQQFFNMRIGVVDLSVSSAVIVPLEADQISSYIGGATLNRYLFHQYQDDPLVFGVGPLTGSFAPASSLLVATFYSPLFEKICHVPFMLRTGPDMKFSGIDFLVVKGAASELSLLYVDCGTVQIFPAGNLRKLPIQDITRALKRDFLPFQSAIVTGPAADHGILQATASVGARGSLDKAGLASRMAAKNLKAILFNGIGGLSFRTNNPDQGKELITRISAEKNFRHRGFTSILTKLDGGKAAVKHLRKLRKKNMACYHCPAPCITHVEFIRQDASQGEGSIVKEGLLLLDHTGWMALAKKVGTHVLPLFHICLQSGLDPEGVSQTLSDGGTMIEWLFAIEKMFPESGKAQIAESYRPTGEAPGKTHTLFGGGIAPIPPSDVWGKRVALSMILGICPLFLLLFPQISETDLLKFISQREDVLKTLEDRIPSLIQTLLAD
jgi:aldehyde:ferredoxin oxidoreductase